MYTLLFVHNYLVHRQFRRSQVVWSGCDMKSTAQLQHFGARKHAVRWCRPADVCGGKSTALRERCSLGPFAVREAAMLCSKHLLDSLYLRICTMASLKARTTRDAQPPVHCLPLASISPIFSVYWWQLAYAFIQPLYASALKVSAHRHAAFRLHAITERVARSAACLHVG